MNDTSSSVNAKIIEIDFDTTKPMWENYLWINRKSPIKHMSSMTYEGGHDMSIYDRFKPTFFGAYVNEKLVGVNSGHKTSDEYYRSRGLYVLADYRRLGISTRLLEATVDQARKENCSYIWTCPRLTSVRAYKKVGFKRVSDWTNEDMEFGPNCICIKTL